MSNPNDFVIENGVLKKYVGPGGDVVVPEGVTEIVSLAFNANQSIKSISVSKTVRQIGEYAFQECKKLTKLQLFEGLETIQEGAFYHCPALKQVVIPASVSMIGKCAFQRCIHLEKVIVCGTPEIEKDAFDRTNAVFLLCKLPLNKVSSRQIKYAALLGWLTQVDSDPDIEINVIKSLKQYYKKAFEQLTADIQLGRCSVEALINRKLLDYEETTKLLDVLQGDVEKTAALLNYRNANFSSAVVEAEENKTVERGLRAPTAAELKKQWATRALDDGTIELITYKGSDTVVAVPAKLGTKQISTIGMDCFAVVATYGDNARTVENMDVRSALCAVRLPIGIRKIDYCAFRRNFMLKDVMIPDSVCQIHPGAFEDCPNLTIHAPAGSFAEQYAKDNNIPFAAK